ncbi:hypothetical protein ACTHQ1_13585 [Janibacter anophelis]|uniref:hypothetical protein n=1 Tax=Janibacter anophelis TaxID=319054 RepID=UPI003F7D4261
MLRTRVLLVGVEHATGGTLHRHVTTKGTPPVLTATRHRLIAAAATTLVLAAGGCGSDSGSSSDATSSSGSAAASSSGSAATSETSASSSGAAGTHRVVVDGTPLTADAWRVKCQKNDAETTGTADLLEDVPLEETADAMFVSVDFDIADGKVSDVKNVSVTGGRPGTSTPSPTRRR